MTCPTCATPNPDGMRFCGRCGNPLQKTTLGRERRNVSVVFVDLSGFSSLTRDWLPEQLRDLADEVLTVVAGIIEDYDGYVDAFQGDGLIALFGAPRSHPDDPQRAVLAAHAALRAIEAIGDSKKQPLKGRAGVNTGVVIAGAIGSGRVRDYTVMGSAVNLAARLEAAAAPGEVWVGPDTFEATRHRMSYEPVSPVTLAGFPSITEVFRLVSVSDADAGDPYAHLQFVGREREVRRLEEAYQEVLETSEAKTLWLVGEAGTGKTRLAREFTGSLAEQERADVLWLEEQTADVGAAWRQLASQVFGLSPSDDRRSWQQRVSAHLNELLPGEPRWQGYILSSVGLAETRPWQRVERRSVDRTFLAWRDLLVALVRRQEAGRGLVLVIEHGSQTAALGDLPDLVTEAPVPILILRISRRTEPPSTASSLHLNPLSLDDSLTLIKQVANPLLKVATESLVFQVGGIPSNILELGRALSVTPQGSFSGSLASLLQARLDMLAPNSRRLLALAALTGERFWGNLIAEVAEVDDLEPLRELSEEKLILREPTSVIFEESEYRFQSELVRRAVLRMIPFSERPMLHLNIATWLERRAPLTLSELIGWHFKEGNSFEAAYPHYLAAADLAQGEENFEAAARLFDILVNLELPPHLLAQGTLAYAQAAISHGDKRRAVEQLSAADGWIELAASESKSALRQVHQQLFIDVQNRR